MADTNLVATPDFTGTVDQRWFVAPLGGPQNPINYLDRFPDSVYNKSIDSRLVKLMYTLLGPAGIGWLRKNYLNARLVLEDHGVELFDLDKFYGDPLSFGRILEEIYDEDPRGLLPRDKWEELRAKDSQYRNRAIDFINGARAGNTPLGMQLVARSGLGHEVEVVENYRWVYDQKADDRLGLPYYGSSKSCEEFVIVPRQELPQSEIQILTIQGSPNAGTFKLFLPLGNEASFTTVALAYNVHRSVVQSALEAFPIVGPGDVVVEGGPLPSQPLRILFSGSLANRDIPQLQAINIDLTAIGGAVQLLVTTERSGTDVIDEVVSISPREQYHLRNALERIKPVATLVSFGRSYGVTSAQTWNQITSTSAYHEVIRYVTGNVGVAWPARNKVYWIERAVEHEAPRSQNDLQYHYQGFHNVSLISAYTEQALTDTAYLVDSATVSGYASEHIGSFTQYQRTLFPFLDRPVDSQAQATADRALADYAEPLTATATTPDPNTPTQLINGIYPAEYQHLPGVPEIRYKDEQFWASLERDSGDEYLEIDLGAPKAVNYLYLEVSNKPVSLDLDFDTLDLAPERNFVPVTLLHDIPSTTGVGFTAFRNNPWEKVEINFANSLGGMIYTRFLRLRFRRRTSPLFTTDNGASIPFSIEARNLRVARNVS